MPSCEDKKQPFIARLIIESLSPYSIEQLNEMVSAGWRFNHAELYTGGTLCYFAKEADSPSESHPAHSVSNSPPWGGDSSAWWAGSTVISALDSPRDRSAAERRPHNANKRSGTT